MTRAAFVLAAVLGSIAGLIMLRRQMFGDPSPATGWRDLEACDSV